MQYIFFVQYIIFNMVSQTSINQYIKTYNALVRNVGSHDIDKIFKFILDSNVKNNTKTSYLNSIISLKKHDNNLVGGDLSKIIELRDKLNVEIENDRAKNNITSKQSHVMETVTINDLHDFVNTLNANKYSSSKNLEDYILIALMVKYPLRNDLQDILIITNKKECKGCLVNYLYVPPKGEAILRLSQYKTAKTNGDITINVDADLSSDIRKLLKIDGRKFLFVDKHGNPLTSSNFTHRLNRIFTNQFGLPISSTLIRKIYLTGKYKNVLEDMRDDAHIMGHSMATQQASYIKNT